MKRLVPLALMAMFVFAAVAVSFPSGSNAQSAGLVSSALSTMERNHKNMKSLRANISMEKYNSQLRDSDKYYGVVLYIPGVGRNAFVKIEWQSPQHEIVTVAKGQYMAYRPRLNIERSAGLRRNAARGARWN